MEKYNLKNKTDIKMHNVLFATTSERDYDMERLLLLEDMPDLVDSFIGSLTDEDYELLKETRACLQNKINYGNSASVVIMALGENYDDTEDRMKIRTLDRLIDLLKSRKEYKEALLKQQEEQKNRQEAIAIFRTMGMF